jgi:hypothetical protein
MSVMAAMALGQYGRAGTIDLGVARALRGCVTRRDGPRF